LSESIGILPEPVIIKLTQAHDMNEIEFKSIIAIMNFVEKNEPSKLCHFAKTYSCGKVRVSDPLLKDERGRFRRPENTVYDKLENQVWSYIV
jgi:hypothetical protein